MRFNVILAEGKTQHEMTLREMCMFQRLELTDDQVDAAAQLVEGDSMVVPAGIIIKRFPYNVDLDSIYNLATGSDIVVRFNDSWYDHPAKVIVTDTITRAAIASGRDITMEVMYWSYPSRCWLRANVTQKQIVHISSEPFAF